MYFYKKCQKTFSTLIMPKTTKTLKLAPFQNEPPTDFSNPKNKREMMRAIEKVRGELGKAFPARIGAELRSNSEQKLISTNPCNYREVVATFPLCDKIDVEHAIGAATEAFEWWKKTPVEKRASYLLKAAEKMRKRKHEFSAMMIFEVAKNWAEADMDTAEAIDFMEFYAREALRLCAPQPVVKSPKWLGKEVNELIYIPLGVGAILPPWNFALSIMVGMTTSALVAGNTVVLKPSPDAPFVAAKFAELMDEVGLPKGVLNVIYGGAEVGEAMVEHPKTRFISFTGSKAVGLKINEAAAKLREGQKWIKRVIAEMGGKDAIIIEPDANLDEAVKATIQSAFGFSGQKCSACSRVIINEKVYDDVVEKLIEQARTLTLGDAVENPAMSAVSSEKAFKKISEYIEIGKEEAKLVFGGKADSSKGWFIEPTIFADVEPKARIAQEEIFGPVLACIKAANFDEALQIANDTEYGLTGGVFTKNRKKLERAKAEFFVGNLYLNRKITGALVGVHPFGGFNLSGTDSKAGGRDYLLNFLQGKSIAERLA